VTRDFLTRRTAATPDRLAVVDAADGRKWRYRDLNQWTDAVATHLSGLAENPAERSIRVGTLLTPRPAFAVTFHAAMRRGWTVVGLHTRLEGELADRLARTDPDLLVCERETRAMAEESDVPVVSVDNATAFDGDTHGTGPREPADTETEAFDPGETAVVLFTSGTTGEPKAVRLTGANLHASAIASALRLGVAPGDRWLDCLPVSHAGGLSPVVRAAVQGTTVLFQRDFETAATARAIERFDATGISLVPTQLQRLLDAGETLPGIETVLLGGAPAPESLLDRARDAGVPVCPTYGLTEAASQVATALPDETARHPGTVGQPLYRTRVTVLDDGEPVDPGERGELVVAGPTVTPGYLDGEAAVCEYGLHTGDVGYRDDDGRLWVVGRRDDLLLSGGELVAPDEVAATLCEHPAVTDAAVLGLADSEWGERVAALVVGDIDPATLREYCREHLADYKCPKTIVVADGIPRTASGTVDREAVRQRLARQA
jgi:O-succinylbenzoic acid--CoA ligase